MRGTGREDPSHGCRSPVYDATEASWLSERDGPGDPSHGWPCSAVRPLQDLHAELAADSDDAGAGAGITAGGPVTGQFRE